MTQKLGHDIVCSPCVIVYESNLSVRTHEKQIISSVLVLHTWSYALPESFSVYLMVR